MAKCQKFNYRVIMIYNDKEIKKRFGAKVRDYRKAKGLTQEQLAKLTGCSWQTISGLETGYSFPSSKILFNLSNVLKMPLVYFFNFYPNSIDNENETRLVNIFRELNKEQQKMLLQMMQALIKKD